MTRSTHRGRPARIGPFCLLSLLTACATTPGDGVYPVLDSARTAADLRPVAGQRVLAFPHRFVRPELRPAPTFVLVPDRPGVTFDLAGPPLPVHDPERGDRLQLQFTAAAGDRLRRFTAELVGGQVVVVIGGEVVTMHKVRAPISGGAVEVSC